MRSEKPYWTPGKIWVFYWDEEKVWMMLDKMGVSYAPSFYDLQDKLNRGGTQ